MTSRRFCVRMDSDTIERAKANAKAAGTNLEQFLRDCIRAIAEGRTRAQELGAMGGEARALALTAEERSAIARKAAKARWSGGK